MRTDLSRPSHPAWIAAFLALSAAACADQAFDDDASQDRAVASENGLSYNGLSYNGLSYNGLSYNGFSFNGLSYNGLSYNGLSYNGLSYNGLSYNGLSTTGALSSTNGLMTTEGGRDFVSYLVKIAYPAGHNLVKQDQYGTLYTFAGSLGVAPEAENGTCDLDCQERISGAMLAHVNNSGLHVGIWLVGPDNGIGWGSSPDYPFQEATYFGNLFASNMPGNYCSGRNMGAGDVKGRVGNPFGNNSAILNSPYGWTWDGASGQNVPMYCASGFNYCTPQNEGFSSCMDQSPQAPYGAGHAWTHPVTVYRNFEPTQIYKICNKSGGKCLGVVGGSVMDGANVEQRAFTGAAGQTWRILQVSPGIYKLINETSGKSIDVNGAQVVQRTFTGVASQQVPIAYTTGQPGFANLKVASIPGAVFSNLGSITDGALIQDTTGPSTADSAMWTFTAIGSASLDPGRTYNLVPQQAPTKAIDVLNNSTANGTTVQQYTSWNGDQQKFFVADAGKGTVKITMKANRNKCLGPKLNSTTSGTLLEVQDCNGSPNQTWMTGETTAGSSVFIFRNAAAPGLCLDVYGGSTADGARIDISTCTGAYNQQFAARLAP